MPERFERNLAIGSVYEHCGDPKERYRVIAVTEDVTNYEETGQIRGGTVTYIQEHLWGDYPWGKNWTRTLDDFNATIVINGQEIPKFQLTTQESDIELPEFVACKLVRVTQNFRVVMDWKPGLEDQPNGQRFFIEPKTEEAERMLEHAASLHRIPNFNPRMIGETQRQSLRADFIKENLGPLFLGEVVIPEEGKDSVPSPDRMEDCLKEHPERYSFRD